MYRLQIRYWYWMKESRLSIIFVHSSSRLLFSSFFMHIVKYLLIYFLCFRRSLSANNNDFNPYDVLGLTRTASDKDIRQAYKKLARHWHPDKNSEPNAHEQFTKINAAYEVKPFTEKTLSMKSPRFRSYRIQPNDKITMNTGRRLKTITAVSIPIISAIPTIYFALILEAIFISFMNRPRVRRRLSIRESSWRIFYRIAIKNHTCSSGVRIFACNAGKL